MCSWYCIFFTYSQGVECPSGSEHNHCGPACPQPTCQNPAGSGGSCNETCVEGCFCKPGFVLSGNQCVPLSECGCTDEDGKYRPVSAPVLNSKVFWLSTRNNFGIFTMSSVSLLEPYYLKIYLNIYISMYVCNSEIMFGELPPRCFKAYNKLVLG